MVRVHANPDFRGSIFGAMTAAWLHLGIRAGLEKFSSLCCFIPKQRPRAHLTAAKLLFENLAMTVVRKIEINEPSGIGWTEPETTR